MISTHRHSFAPEAGTVKCKEKDWFRRGIAEAIWIAKKTCRCLATEADTLCPRSTTNFCHHVTLTPHRDYVTTRKLQKTEDARRPEVSGQKLVDFHLNTGDNVIFYQ